MNSNNYNISFLAGYALLHVLQNCINKLSIFTNTATFAIISEFTVIPQNYFIHVFTDLILFTCSFEFIVLRVHCLEKCGPGVMSIPRGYWIDDALLSASLMSSFDNLHGAAGKVWLVTDAPVFCVFSGWFNWRIGIFCSWPSFRESVIFFFAITDIF